MKNVYLLVLGLILSLQAVSQETGIDSLKALLHNPDQATVLKALNELCWELRFQMPTRHEHTVCKPSPLPKNMGHPEAQAQTIDGKNINSRLSLIHGAIEIDS